MRPMKLPQGNVSPVVTSIAVVGGALVVLVAGGAAMRVTAEALGALAAQVVMAGVILGAWASQAAAPWSRTGYVWRFGVALIVVLLLAAVCGAPPGAE